ncbi:hypothetical protein [Roseinatronobacter sp. S2]|uniref:hypothetical protein n=1 Tax=Roseinatronobacter sp. S2 TaxID=3035471 RepID=UPI00240F2F98|nr:hypothetical protein [Roseinatronobacter sp. S2]WFE74799.1 hypothetical protein P8S53_16660 [Roseinatronobacter sp. S2]
MDKPHPVELREHAVSLVAQGNTHTEAARRLCVSIKFVNDMMRLKHETGSLAPKPQGDHGRCKLTGVKGWVERRIAEQPGPMINSGRRSAMSANCSQTKSATTSSKQQDTEPIKRDAL